MIKIFGSMNSNARMGERSYNEVYVSNPKPPMAVFAYSLDIDEEIDNPLYFLNRDWTTLEEDESMIYPPDVVQRTEFLRKFAIKHDIPFVVFSN